MILARALRASFPKVYARAVIGRLVRDAMSNGEPELRLIHRLARETGVIVDVGANRGIYSFVARRHGFDVVAIEPNPELAAFIRDWADDRVTVIEASASDRARNVTLEIPVDRGTELDGLARVVDGDAGTPESSLRSEEPARARGVDVRAIRIDDLDLRRVQVVKIDVEGHELNVIAGAMRTLARERPAVIVEVEERHRPGGIASVRELLESLGYRGFFWSSGECRPIEEFSAARWQNASSIRADGTRDGPYINNFIYVPSAQAAESSARLRAAG